MSEEREAYPYPLRVMIDTNVVISALLNKEGAPGLIVKEVLAQGDELVVCPYIIEEAQKVLARKFPRLAVVWNTLSHYLPMTILPPPRARHLSWRLIPKIRDECDQEILNHAIAHDVHVLVTDDYDFHVPEIKSVIPVMTSTEFWHHYNQDRSALFARNL